MKVRKCDNWREFKEFFEGYFHLPLERRSQIIFRGQNDSGLSLTCTLDREKTFGSSEERTQCIGRLIREFRKASHGLFDSSQLTQGKESIEWMLLGRHHGLKTPILDWTESPYVASFFAYNQIADQAEKGFVSVWMLDRAKFLNDDFSQISVIDDDEVIKYNPRAIEQRGLFIHVRNIDKPIEELFGEALGRIDLPKSEYSVAMTDLDEMVINSRALFRDLDGAAQMANRRIL